MTNRKSRTTKLRPQTNESGTMPFDVNTPCGLFEKVDGDRFIVTESELDDRPSKVAVTLESATLPEFGVHVLSEEVLGRGRWMGAYRVRLTHYQPCEEDPKPGTIFLGEHCLYLAGRVGQGRVEWISLGDVGKKGLKVCNFYKDPWCDFHGWNIEPASAPMPFASQAPRGERTWSLDVKTFEQPKTRKDVAKGVT